MDPRATKPRGFEEEVNAPAEVRSAHQGAYAPWEPWPRGTRLHLGGGAGVTINERRLDVGLYRIQRTKAQFSVFPEIGGSIPFDWSLRGVLAVRYNYSLKSGDTPAQEYVGISVGLAWN